ncbi:SCP1.201-like deaminase [Amycolatopsis arida]|uniref:SCP1.201-like deaminase n=1 Tax=Amycolatopsis arida TaxID=587909 RepID=A0A1I5WTH9_9PSEU|nr:DddA-like double-stranded DNA deaminase toxin [Amycolatopsis arida]TDX92433.1 nucleic acid/nucleotide deaminase of polymorphic system toxin [Amycolatopsis arida]SFQ22776.1 SCP1.201-like deaminase [Amycolatopsis arida]
MSKSVGNLAAAVEAVLTLVERCRVALREAAAALEEAGTVLEPLTRGTADCEFGQLPAVAARSAADLDRLTEPLDTVNRHLRAYLDRLGATRPPPSNPTAPMSAGPVKSTSTEVPPHLAERVERSRARVGQRPPGTVPARGEWLRSDGWTVRMASGDSDEHFRAGQRFVLDHLPPAKRPAEQLARHVEVKVAMAMRREGLTDETVVIDRQVCGTRDFDRRRNYSFTCDRYLSEFLAPGARLRVVQGDGTIRVYEGGSPS